MNWRKLSVILVMLVLAACGGAPRPSATEVATPLATSPSSPTASAPSSTPAQSPTPAATPTSEPAPAPSPTPAPPPNTQLVDPGHDLGPISPYVYGTNFGPWLGLRPETLRMAYYSGITIIRWPGGEWGDRNDIQLSQLDAFVDLARKIGAEPYIHVRFMNGTPEKAADVVRYANIEKGYNIKFWSIGNEPSLFEQWQGVDKKWDTASFNQEWRKFADAMKAADPTILLLGPETHQFTGNAAWDPKDSKGLDWMRQFLKTNGDKVDIVSFHRYPFPNNASRSAAKIPDLRSNAPAWNGIIQNLRRMIREETGRDLPVALTEFNSHYSSAIGGEATLDSHYNAIWLGDVLGRLISEKVEVVTQFALSGKFGLLESYNARPSYYPYQLYQRFGREQVYAASGVTDVSVYAARRADGALSIILINLGDAEVTAPLAIQGGAPAAQAEVFLFDQAHKAEQVEPLAVSAQTNVTLPSQSIMLLVIGGRAPFARQGREVTVWAPYFGTLEQMTFQNNADLIREANFMWYMLQADGAIAGMASPQAVQAARAAGIRIVPAIQNAGFDRARVARIIADPALRQAHVADIVKLVQDNEFDGIDIDYESLAAEDRDPFSLFIEALGAALHAQGKLLSVTVHAKSNDRGEWGGTQAQDWARLGKAADEFKIMTYDFHNGASEAGAIAPLDRVNDVLKYAKLVVPPEKTYVGVPFYGYDWTGSVGRPLDWRKATKTAGMYSGVEIQRDESNEAWFTYSDGRNTVYFNDALTTRTRLERIFTDHPHLAGISIWSLGGEDPDNWPAIREAFSGK